MSGRVVFTFDNMGAAAAIGRGEAVGPTYGDIEAVEGYPWLLDLLEDRSICGSFFLEGWNGVHHPDRVREIVERGHDVGLHGWVHENWGALADQDARRLIHDGTAALRSCGAASQIFRAPGGSSSVATRRCLTDLGYRVDASLIEPSDTDDEFTSPLARVSFEWPLVDGYYYLHLHRDDVDAASHIEEAWLARVARAAADGETIVFIAHAFLSGAAPDRRAAFERVVDAALSSPELEVLSLLELTSALRD